jgi:plastocyanin
VRFLVAIGVVLIVAAGGCGGGVHGDGGDAMSMTSPSSAAAAIVTIVGQKGVLSFDPNPAPVAPGGLVVWRNTDAARHRIVMNDGSFDSGDIAPGGSSPAMRLGLSGGGYHCTIHPTMMYGSIN